MLDRVTVNWPVSEGSAAEASVAATVTVATKTSLSAIVTVPSPGVPTTYDVHGERVTMAVSAGSTSPSSVTTIVTTARTTRQDA